MYVSQKYKFKFKLKFKLKYYGYLARTESFILAPMWTIYGSPTVENAGMTTRPGHVLHTLPQS